VPDVWLHGRHREMGTSNITFEDLEKSAQENGRSVAETIAIMDRTEAIDRREHAQEYATTEAPG